MKKRMLSLMMILILALSAIPGLSETPDRSWSEIESALVNDIIPYSLIGEDLTKGLTHAELSALAVRLFEAFWQTQELRVKTPYATVEGHPLQSEIEKAYGLGFLVDMNGAYYPNYLATRQRAAQVLCRVLKSRLYDGWTLDQDDRYPLHYDLPFRFADEEDIESGLVDSVYYLAVNDLMEGMNAELFCPTDAVSRAAAIIAANRIYLKYRNAPVYMDQPGGESDQPDVEADQESVFSLKAEKSAPAAGVSA